MNACDVVFAFMPASWLEYPSLALGLFRSECDANGIACKVFYSNHRFAEFVGIDAYNDFSRLSDMFAIAWESLFTEAAGFTPRVEMRDMVKVSVTELKKYYDTYGLSDDVGADEKAYIRAWEALHSRVDAFIEREADAILSLKPKVVACSMLTEQRNASFALMRRVKEKAPDVITLLGGGECTLETARAYLGKVPAIDYIFAGEGDGVMADVLKLLIAGKRREAEEKHPYLIFRGRTDGVFRAIGDMNTAAVPDFSDYVEQVKGEAFGDRFSHLLLVEGSRGCWWGEKNRCRFCAMHVSEKTICYRPKTRERLLDELAHLSQDPFWDCVNLSDCILDHELIRGLPDEPDRPIPWSIYAEIKSNIRPEDLLKLRRWGFYFFQPGIESIQDDLLRAMHKGASAIQQVQLLKFARQAGLHMQWNILHTFPGDRREWYDEMIALMPLIHHLQPPANTVQMLLMRHSRYVEEPEKYGLETLLPQAAYDAVDPDDEAFTRETASLWMSPQLLIDGDTIARLKKAVQEWKSAYFGGAFLARRATEEGLYVHDTRAIRKNEHYLLQGARRAVAEGATTITSDAALHQALDGTYGQENVDEAICFLTDNCLLVRLSGQLLFLALPKCLPYRKGKMKHGLCD